MRKPEVVAEAAYGRAGIHAASVLPMSAMPASEADAARPADARRPADVRPRSASGLRHAQGIDSERQ